MRARLIGQESDQAFLQSCDVVPTYRLLYRCSSYVSIVAVTQFFYISTIGLLLVHSDNSSQRMLDKKFSRIEYVF